MRLAGRGAHAPKSGASQPAHWSGKRQPYDEHMKWSEKPQPDASPAWARFYNEVGSSFAVSVAPRIRRLYEATEMGRSTKTLLDVCCGTGQLARHFLDHGYEVTGLDLSEACWTTRDSTPVLMPESGLLASFTPMLRISSWRGSSDSQPQRSMPSTCSKLAMPFVVASAASFLPSEAAACSSSTS